MINDSFVLYCGFLESLYYFFFFFKTKFPHINFLQEAFSGIKIHGMSWNGKPIRGLEFLEGFPILRTS